MDERCACYKTAILNESHNNNNKDPLQTSTDLYYPQISRSVVDISRSALDLLIIEKSTSRLHSQACGTRLPLMPRSYFSDNGKYIEYLNFNVNPPQAARGELDFSSH